MLESFKNNGDIYIQAAKWGGDVALEVWPYITSLKFAKNIL